MVDCIVMGAGLSGLCAAARLCRAGFSVIILEKHSIPGGCASWFRRKGIQFDVGLHELNGIDEQDPKMELWAALELDKKLKLQRLDELYTVRSQSLNLSLPTGESRAFQTLMQAFPESQTGILELFEILRRAHRREAALLQALESETVIHCFHRLGLSPRCQMFLLANCGYYHHDPAELSMFWWSTCQASYLFSGTCYIEGGARKLVETLVADIKKHGGTFSFHEEIQSIQTEGKRVLELQTLRRGQLRRHTAKTFVSAIPLPVFAELCPHEKYHRRIQALQPSPSLCSLYMNLQPPLSTLGHKSWCTLYLNEKALYQHSQSPLPLQDYHQLGLTLIDYSQPASELEPSNNSTATLCALDSVEGWPSPVEQPKAYQEAKQQRAEDWLKRVRSDHPELGLQPIYQELATPHTIERYTANPGGAVYGFAQTCSQSGTRRKTHRSPFKNVEIASAWSRPGGGFSGALLSGWQAALRLMQKE